MSHNWDGVLYKKPPIDVRPDGGCCAALWAAMVYIQTGSRNVYRQQETGLYGHKKTPMVSRGQICFAGCRAALYALCFFLSASVTNSLTDTPFGMNSTDGMTNRFPPST